MAASSGGSQTSFGSSTRMALVSFRDQAKLEMDLTHDAHTLRNLVDTLQADGGTDHASAFRMAGKVLSKNRSKDRTVIMFTDGEASTFAPPIAATKKLRDDGVEIYCIGLLANTQQIYQWASEPKEQHLAHTEDPALLHKLFREVAAEIALSGFHDAFLQVELTPDFQLESDSWKVSPGTVQAIGKQKLEWQIASAGATPKPRTCTLRFGVQHIGTQGGQKPFATAVRYRDQEGHALAFVPPELQVNCPTPEPPPPKPQFTSFVIPGCQDAFCVQLGDLTMPPPSPKPDTQTTNR